MVDKRILILAVLVLASCRETPLETSLTPTPTFRIEGRVTDRFLNPVTDVDVYLYYNYDFLDMQPVPVLNWYVPDDTKRIDAIVYDHEGTARRTIFSGMRPTGGFYADWDGKDAFGKRLNGVFQVRYVMDDTVRHYYVRVVDGSVAARTDSTGRYSIGSEQLPIDVYPAPLYSSDGTRFSGNYQIDPKVDLVFVTPLTHSVESVYLFKGYVGQLDVIIR